MSNKHHSSTIYDSAYILGLEQTYCASRSAAVVSSCVISSGMAGSLRSRIYEGGRKAVYTATAAAMLQNLIPTYLYAADIVVSSGVVSSGLTISGNGNNLLIISGGSTIDITVFSSGAEHISNGGLDTNATISYGGSQFISSGGVASNALVNYGSQVIFSGGVASDTTINGGSQYINSYGLASNTTINSGGSQYVTMNAMVYDTEVYAGGAQNVLSGGKVYNTIQHSGGNINVTVQGCYYANSTYVSGTNQNGETMLLESGVASNFIINEGGW